MRAEDKFHKGQRVQVTKEGRDAQIGPRKGSCWGTVVGFSSKNPDCVRVMFDGYACAEAYHMDFIQ